MKLLAVCLCLLALIVPVTAKPKGIDEISVKINSQTTFKRQIKVRFVELIEDSRCPIDTNCIWSGEAKIKVEVTRKGTSKTIELSTLDQGEGVTFAGYRFELVDLDPKPRSNVRISRNGYIAKIRITKIRK